MKGQGEKEIKWDSPFDKIHKLRRDSYLDATTIIQFIHSLPFNFLFSPLSPEGRNSCPKYLWEKIPIKLRCEKGFTHQPWKDSRTSDAMHRKTCPRQAWGMPRASLTVRSLETGGASGLRSTDSSLFRRFGVFFPLVTLSAYLLALLGCQNTSRSTHNTPPAKRPSESVL